jgi:hypothetical protein
VTARRYTDREFALIVRKAFELEEQAPRTVAGRDGLTIEEMQSIAAEVGLEPGAIEAAAALVPAERSGAAATALGAPESWTWELRFDHPLDEDAGDVFLQTIRRILSQRGEVRRVGNVVEWKSVGRSDHIWITLSSHDDATVVEITGDRRPSLLFSVLGPLLFWGVIAALTGIMTSIAGAAFILPAAALAATWLTARVAWRSASRRLRARLERLAIALRSDASRLSVGPGGADH